MRSANLPVRRVAAKGSKGKRLRDKDPVAAQLPAKAPIATKSIPASPFADVSPLREELLELLSDSILEEPIHRLSSIPRFRGFALTPILAPKGKQIDVRQFGRQLAV